MSYFKKTNFLKIVLAITFVLVTVCVFTYPENALRFIPLYFSMGIAFLSAKANRFSYIFGGLNCILYSLVFLKLKLYSSVASCLLMSLPLQLATFILWGKNKYKKTTIFKKLSKKQMIAVSVLAVASWMVLNLATSLMGAKNTLIDSLATIIGTVGTILTMLQYIEYTYVGIVSNLITQILYFSVLPTEPSQITYIIFQTYSIICSFITRSTVMAYYKEQRKMNAEKTL